MALDLVGKLGIGAVLGVAIGYAARATFRRLDYPTQGLYPVASIATAALAYGLTEVAHGSGFLAVYLTALMPGHRGGARQADHRRLPPGPGLGGADLALLHARPAGLPRAA